jgi:hypothetical protein
MAIFAECGTKKKKSFNQSQNGKLKKKIKDVF